MLKTILVALLPILVILGNGLDRALTRTSPQARQDNTGTMQKMIVANGTVALDLNLSRLGGSGTDSKGARTGVVRFDAEADSFFTVIVFNDELRGPLPSAMKLIPQGEASLPAKLMESYENLVVENMPVGSPYELAVRDGRTGFLFFNIEGHQFNYDPSGQSLSVDLGRLLISKEFAAALGRPGDSGALAGQISINASMRPIEIVHIVDGEAKSEVLPANTSPNPGTVPGPDVVVGDLSGLAQFGSSSGTQVGLAVGTDSCNFGTVDLNWFANPNNDHPVIPQNLYRMSGGSGNDERFEQVGQSNVKHAFTALTNNICNLGCNGVGGSRLGSGCSDPYGASLNSGPNLGSRAWINPFTGFYPRNDSATPNNSHTGHAHPGPSHRILTEIADLSTSQNPGATYYAEGQYITPHEYAWCQSNPTQCNMFNNVSYRRYNVVGTGSPFTFSPVGSTVRAKPAIEAWTGATLVQIRPDPADGIAIIGYKVTNPSPGVWHYEYAIYNQNLDRAIQSFSLPKGTGVTISNIGFHAPPQHPGWTGDGTAGNTGYSSTPWTSTDATGSITWDTESFASNPNANAVRWGTLYNYRFNSNRPPQTVDATVGFFKTGAPITVQVQGPAGVAAANVSVAGRVTNQGGSGIGGARVFMIDSGGNARIAVTNPFGYYRFDNVQTGTYTVGVSSKRYTFPAPTMVPINDNVTNLDFVAEP